MCNATVAMHAWEVLLTAMVLPLLLPLLLTESALINVQWLDRPTAYAATQNTCFSGANVHRSSSQQCSIMQHNLNLGYRASI